MKALSFLNPEKFVAVSYQIFLIVINLGICFYLLDKSAVISREPAPTVYAITSADIQQSGITAPHMVETGMYIENFQEFDLLNNHFIVSADVWFKFDPKVISLDMIGKFSFDKGEILTMSKPVTKMIGDKLLAEYRVQLKFSASLNHRVFPTGGYYVYLILSNTLVSPNDIVFTSSESSFTLSPNLFIEGWKEVGHSITAGYNKVILDRHDSQTIIYYPMVLFGMDFLHEGMRSIFVIIFPLFILFFIALLTLSLGPTTSLSLAIELSLGEITGLLAYRYVIDTLSPKVNDFMLSDHVYNLILVLSFLIFFFHLSARVRDSNFVRGSLVISLQVIFIAVMCYLLIFWL